MFDRSQSRIIIILGLLGFFACVLSLPLLTNYSTIDFKFPLEKDEIINAADEFINLQTISFLPLSKQAKVASDQGSIIYLQKKLGVGETGKLLDFLPLYYWQVNYAFVPDKSFILFPKKIIRIFISPQNAKVIGYSRLIDKEVYAHVSILSKKEAGEIASSFLSLIEFEISGFRMSRYSAIERKYIFEWDKEIPGLKKAKLKVKMEIFGDEVGTFNYFLHIPVSEFAGFRLNNIINTIFSVVLNIFVFALGIFVLILAIIKRKELDWRFGSIFAILMAIAYLINFLKTGFQKGFYFFLFIFISAIGCIISFFWTMIVSCVSKYFSQKSKINLFPIKISSSILVSYIFFITGLGFTMLFFVFVIKVFNPIATLGFDSFFSEFPSVKIACLIAPLLSLGAAVSEEIFFRALLISFLKKYIKKTVWVIVLSSLFWCFLHVSPFGYSDIYPGVAKGFILLPIGILFGYIFIRFGLVCAIVTHYLHDLVVVGTGYLEFSNFRHINMNVVTLLLSAIIPLLVALYFKFREKNA